MSATSLQHMTQSDFLSWRMEADPVLRSTIVAVGLLDRAPDWDRFVAMMRRAVDLVEVFRCKTASDPLGILAPRWVPDPDFDLSWHLRRFTAAEPGYRPLLDFAESAAMSAFDKDRPLWEFTVLDGLPEGRAALVMKVHHSLTDGLGGMQIAGHVVDFTREGTDRTDASGTTPIPEDRIRPSVDGGSVGWYAGTIGGLLRRTSTAVARAGSRVVRQPVGAIGDYVATANSTVRFARPIRTTLSPLMVHRSTRRRVALVDVSIDALRAASAAAGVSMNDAFLAAVLLGVSQYHCRHGKCGPAAHHASDQPAHCGRPARR